MLSRIKNYALLGLLLFGVTMAIMYWNSRKKVEILGTQVHQTEQILKDERGVWVTTSYNVKADNAYLRDIRRSDSTHLTLQEQRIKEMVKEMNALKLKIKDTDSGTSGTMNARIDTIIKWKMKRGIPYIDPIKTPFWDLKFPVDTIRMRVGFEGRYTNTFNIFLGRQKEWASGKKIKHPRLPWWWILKDWKYLTTVSSLDTSAYIDKVLTVTF